MNILIVDDETIIRKGILKLLGSVHSEIAGLSEARNGEEALEKVGADEPDIVITDIQMPVMDGLQLIEILRRTHPHIEIVILTGYAEFDYVQRALRQQVTDYLLKPVTKEGLEEVISKLLLKDPAKWMAETGIETIKAIRETTGRLVKGIIAENAVQVESDLDAWFAHCRDNGYSLLKVKQLMGYLQLFLRSELFLNLKASPGGSAAAPLNATTSRELADHWRDYARELISFVSELRAPRNKRIVDLALAAIEREYGDPGLNLGILAERAGVSSAYMSKIFREVMKKPITQYISDFRLDRARRRLQAGDDATIAAIAEACGFTDYPYFSKLFKKHYGVSPLEYKEKA